MTQALTLEPPPRERAANRAAECCTSVVGATVDAERAETLARVFKALGDPTRVRLISLIAAHEGAEACVCDLTAPVGLSQPTVSHHLKILTDAGFLSRSKRGTWAFYRLVPGALDSLARLLVTA